MKNIFKSVYALALVSIILPVASVFAQGGQQGPPDPTVYTGGDARFGEFILDIISFINNTLTPFVFAVALLLFIYGAYLYFIQEEEDEKRKAGKNYMLWAFIALVIMVSVWGITNLIAGGFGFDDPDAIDGLIPNAALI